MALHVTSPAASELKFPWPEPAPVGQPIEVAPGILWLRMALPFALDHVNLYLIEDRGGWAVFDTGISDGPSQAAWERVLAGPLGGKTDHPADRQPFPSRSCRAGRLARSSFLICRST